MHWKKQLAKEIKELEGQTQTSSVRSKISRLRRRMIQNPAGKNQQTKKTHCPYNHKYTKKNTSIQKDGSRVCRQCRRERRAKRSQARKKH